MFAVSRERKQAEKEGEETGKMGFKVVRRDAPHTFVTEDAIKLSEGITAPHYFYTSQYNLLSACDEKVRHIDTNNYVTINIQYM